MFAALGQIVSRHWLAVILGWIALAVALRCIAPPWHAIAHDGDFAYLPASMPSAVGERWLREAFPYHRAQSQMALLVARTDRRLDNDDLHVAYDVARRFKNLLGVASLTRSAVLRARAADETRGGAVAAAREGNEQADAALQLAQEAFNEAIELDQLLAEHWQKIAADAPARAIHRPPPLIAAYHNRALLAERKGELKQAQTDRAELRRLDPRWEPPANGLVPAWGTELPLLDVWTWHKDIFGSRLVSSDRHARLIVLQLSNEFMAADNIRVLGQVEEELLAVRNELPHYTQPGLYLGLTGSAAVGGDLLRSAAESIRHTEWTSIVLVLIMLVLIYRSPLLVAVPILAITISLVVAVGVVALLTQLHHIPGFGGWQLKVFTTTRVFVVVILFGAGTDFCLFLISRFEEELSRGQSQRAAAAAALAGVGDSLAASALTTISGLAMMFFADFGKFHFSGPVIALCLSVTFLACITLAPALLAGLGAALFWPRRISQLPQESDFSPRYGRGATRLWRNAADLVIAFPGRLLVISVLVMLPLAVYGLRYGTRVTYDFLSELSPRLPSREGAEVYRHFFSVGENSPLTVLLRRPGGNFNQPASRDEIRSLSDQLHIPGVVAVRSSEDPLGDYGPGEKPGLLSSRGRSLRILRVHPRVKATYLTQAPELVGDVVRFEVILGYDPFTLEAVQTVDRLEQTLRTITASSAAFWSDAEFAFAGTSAAIRDLRQVTGSDYVRIQGLVVLAVLLTLLAILRRPLVCVYMVLSVLFTFYVTLGITQFVFAQAFAPDFQGLDWKTPLFLFVILVAVGQDYNVYLATRVFEEQRQYGPFQGLRRAIVHTGGIITSCGLIMAGTFVAMTSGTWGPILAHVPGLGFLGQGQIGALRSIVELGFSLALGILIDTLVVRSLLVPAFLAILCRVQAGRS